MSSPPPMVWPPSNPSGAVVPFPLPWGQTGCCPPGGMDALMKCYCDIQAASAFIGQIMIDQINNNPAVTEAIIAAIEKSGSSLPLIGVTNGQPAQPGQVGEFFQLSNSAGTFPSGPNTQIFSVGVLQPGDWMMQAWMLPSTVVQSIFFETTPAPLPGASNGLAGFLYDSTPPSTAEQLVVGQSCQLLTSVPTLIAFTLNTTAAAAGGFQFAVECWRMR